MTTKAEIRRISLERRTAILAYIEAHQPVATMQIVDHFQMPKPVLFHWLRIMAADEYVTFEQSSISGHRQNLYSRGPNQEPLAEFKTGAYMAVKDAVIKRRLVKAEQIGMWRDPLVAAFFGMARA